MEELIIIFKTENQIAIPFLCSRNVLIEDKILFENNSNSEILEGKVTKIDIENELVTVINDNEQFIVNNQNCFFPIIEVYNNQKKFFNKQEVEREKITFSTICPKCEKHSRNLENCSQNHNSCLKNQIKPYAFIKL